MNNEIRKYASTQPQDSFHFKIEINSQSSVVHHLRFINLTTVYKKLYDKAMIEFKDKKDGIANCSQLRYDPKKKVFVYHAITPNNMFPSKDFRNFKDIIIQTIKCSSKLGSYQITPLLLDGEPGLGKSKSLGYLAYGSQLSNIKRVDMTEFINHNLDIDTILTEVFYNNTITGHTLIMIDEIDKYIAGMLDKTDEPDNIGKINQSMLNSILSLIERDTGKKFNLFVVFCSNNFNTIFNNVDMTHYASMKTRFISIVFHRIDKTEYKEYLQWLHNKLYDNDFPNDIIKEFVDTLPNDFKITFRDLNQCTVKQLFNIEKICSEIYNNHDNYSKPFVFHSPPRNIISNKKIVIQKSVPVQKSVQEPKREQKPKQRYGIHGDKSCDDIVTKRIPDIFIDPPFNEKIWEQLLDETEDIVFSNKGKFLEICDYLINGNYLSEELVFDLKSLNEIIIRDLLTIIMQKSGDKKVEEIIDKILQNKVNIPIFTLALNNVKLTSEEINSYKLFFNLIESIIKYPHWIEYIKSYDKGFIRDFYSFIHNNKHYPEFVNKFISYLEIPNDISLMKFYSKQFNIHKIINIKLLNTIMNSGYFKIYCICRDFYNRVKYHKTDDVYLKSLINKFLQEVKV